MNYKGKQCKAHKATADASVSNLLVFISAVQLEATLRKDERKNKEKKKNYRWSRTKGVSDHFLYKIKGIFNSVARSFPDHGGNLQQLARQPMLKSNTILKLAITGEPIRILINAVQLEVTLCKNEKKKRKYYKWRQKRGVNNQL